MDAAARYPACRFPSSISAGVRGIDIRDARLNSSTATRVGLWDRGFATKRHGSRINCRAREPAITTNANLLIRCLALNRHEIFTLQRIPEFCVRAS